MKKSERFSVYFIGFFLGMVLVSVIMSRKASREEVHVDPWHAHNEQIDAVGAEPLPEGVHPTMLKGHVLRFGYLPSEEAPLERVWLLNFRKSYPYVRVVETIETGELSYMAADQIKLWLADGVDVVDLKPMLDQLELRLRNFKRKENFVVIGVLSTQIDAVPATLAAIQPWSELFEKTEADFLEFRNKGE
ncbi:MAG: hypothetical protein ACPGJU_09015 [Coraliomargarita sp.]